MDEKLSQQLDVLALCCEAFAAARNRRNPDHEWLTLSEREALDNLRIQMAALKREEAAQAV